MNDASMRIAYLIPEFPGQTHIFFWRERVALSKIGIATSLVSTRRPLNALMSHDWAANAAAETFYLADIRLREIIEIVGVSIRLGPKAWIKAIKAAQDGCPPHAWAINIGLLFLAVRLIIFMRAKKLTHVHSHSCANSALIALFAHRLANVTYSLTLHGDLSDYGRQQNVKWRYASFAISITHRLYDQVRQQLGHDVPKHFAVAPMGVDPSIFKRRKAYESWTGKGPLRLFSCGRLNYVKGHQDIICAVSILRQSGMDVHLEIAGEDELGGKGFRHELEAQITHHKVAGNVVLLGTVPEVRVFEGLERAHLFVLASHREPLGVAIMEAMSCGTPVVATNRGGVPEMIEHSVDGYLVPPQDPTALAEAIKHVVQDPPLAKQFSASARTKIQTRFNSDISALEMKRMLNEVKR
jgi:colanic acid/amylovoran biosynthesis glycosyltransferase